MRRVLTTFLFCAAAHAATLNVNISVTGTLAAGTSGFTATGPATLTGGISDTGTFNATIPTSALSSTTTTVPYTLTLKQGNMLGNLTLPVAAIISSGSGSGTMTVTSATGSYSGDTGSFNVTGSGGLSGSSITLNFSGSGTITTGGPPVPAISDVLDAGSYSTNIAQGSIFVVKGSNLSASGYNSTSFPLPTSYGGTSIAFTPASGGSPTAPYLIYTYNLNNVNQLAAVLPSTLAAGTYNVTVTYNGSTSAPFSAQVVATKPAILTQDSTGNGLAVAQNIISATQYDLNRLTTGTIAGVSYSPGKPGQTLVLYATGLGAVPGGDNVASPGYNFLTNGVTVQVIVGGTAIPALYAGRVPGFSGLDQIDFTLPSNITTGCAVPLQVMEGSVLSAATTLSIAPSATATACVYPNLTTSQLESLDQGGTFTQGAFELTSVATSASGQNVTEASIGGAFSQLTGFELSSAVSGSTASLSGAYTVTTIGSCTVYQATATGSSSSSGTTSVIAGGVAKDLDAGKVTINGPTGSNITNEALTETNNAYSLTLGETGITGVTGLPNGVIVAGTYTLAGAGGTDVGSFSTSISMNPLTITGGLPTSVTESSDLPIAWTGGNASDTVEIFGLSEVSSGSGTATTVTLGEFICTTTAGQGSFTVPSAVLTLLPKTSSNSSSGTLEVASSASETNFTAPLTAGGSVASIFLGLSATSSSVAYK